VNEWPSLDVIIPAAHAAETLGRSIDAVKAQDYPNLASIVVAAALVPGVYGFGHRGWSLIWSGAAALLVVVRHRGNIRRLVVGAERRIEA